MNEDLKKRTRDFAIRIINLYASLPTTTEAQVVGKQALRSGTSVGAHYRESQYAKSNADFVSKIQGALQELEETIYWLEIIVEMRIFSSDKLEPLSSEANELRAIFITIAKKVKAVPRNLLTGLYPLSLILYPVVWLQAPHKACVVNSARRGIEQR